MNRYNHAIAPQPMDTNLTGYWITYADYQAESAQQQITYNRSIAELVEQSSNTVVMNTSAVAELAAAYEHQKTCIIDSYARQIKNNRRLACWSWLLLAFIAILEIYQKTPI